MNFKSPYSCGYCHTKYDIKYYILKFDPGVIYSACEFHLKSFEEYIGPRIKKYITEDEITMMLIMWQ